MEENDDRHGQQINNYSSFNQTRHSGNSYMQHRGEGYTSYTNRSAIGVTYQPPSQYALAPTSPLTAAGGQTINTGVTIDNQEAAAGVAVASGGQSLLKRDEKESHCSKHVSSKTSFGNQTSSYLVQQHQAVIGQR